MVRSLGCVQTSAALIDGVQERTYLIEGIKVSLTTCTDNEESLDEVVSEKNVLNKEIRLVSKDPVFHGNSLVVYELDEEEVPKDDERVPIVFRARHFEVLDVGLLGEDVNIEADFVRVYYLGQLVHLYGIVVVVVVYDVKENRKDSTIRLGRKQ